MKNHANVTIAVLSISAVILASAVIVGYLSDQPAYADTPARRGDYIMNTGAWSSSRDLLYIIDVPKQLLNVYAYDINSNAVQLVDQVNLRLAFRDR